MLEGKGIETFSDVLKVSESSVVGSDSAGSGSRNRGRVDAAPVGRKAPKDAKEHQLFQLQRIAVQKRMEVFLEIKAEDSKRRTDMLEDRNILLA